MPAIECPKCSSCYRRGTVVEVRPLVEILHTLDADGKLDGLPFMPEMARYCGGRFTIFRRSDKTCFETVGMRWMEGTVFLEGLRCDGAFHEGCQRGCLYFWKEAWLTPVGDSTESPVSENGTALLEAGKLPAGAECLPTTRGDRFFCQSTELMGATSEFPAMNFRHYVRDFVNGQATIGRLAKVFLRAAANKILRTLGRDPLGGVYGEQAGSPKGDLDLKAGEWVEVKSREEIVATLDEKGRNRGLTFESEMLDHCGRRYQVAYPVRKIILEATGKMAELTNTVVLEGVVCEGTCAKNCPRSNHFYWRECWLRRVES